MSLFFDDINAKFNALRKKKQKNWNQEDLKFAESFQPSTIGHIYSCLYTVVVNRGFKGIFNYPTGLSSLITVNPSEEQVNGFQYVVPPAGWDPMVYDCRSNVIQMSPKQQSEIRAIMGVERQNEDQEEIFEEESDQKLEDSSDEEKEKLLKWEQP